MKWTEKEENYLRENHLIKTVPEMCAELGRTKSSINARRILLGLKRPERIKQEMQARGYFNKGHKPFNKGMKGIHLSPETEFKKGNKPANTLYDGCVTLRYHKRDKRNYLYIRISSMKWKTLHRYNWEKVYGKVPEGYVVAFKDKKDELNCNIENLKLISRADNARRNVNYEKIAVKIRDNYKNNPRKMYPDSRLAMLLSYKDKELREKIMQCPEMLEIKFLLIEQNGAIKNATI